jgi:hypothetical protein
MILIETQDQEMVSDSVENNAQLPEIIQSNSDDQPSKEK